MREIPLLAFEEARSHTADTHFGWQETAISQSQGPVGVLQAMASQKLHSSCSYKKKKINFKSLFGQELIQHQTESG